MPVSRGYPKGSGTVPPATTDELAATSSSESGSATDVDLSSIVSGLADISSGLVQTAKEVITYLTLATGQGLVILADPDYRAYFDLTAQSGSLLMVKNTGTLMVYGDLAIDNASTTYFDNGGTIQIKGE